MRDMVVVAADDLFNVWKYREKFGVTIQTPNLDRLADMGVAFTNAQAPVAVCSPSRAATLTSQSPFTTGFLSPHPGASKWYDIVDLSATLPAILKDAGYSTHGFGKNFHDFYLPDHVEARLFDSYYSAPAARYYPQVDGAFSVGTYEGSEEDLGDYLTVRAATSLIEDYAGQAPLLVMVGLYDPHAPMVSTVDYKEIYPLDDIVIPQWFGDVPPEFVDEFLRTRTWENIERAGWEKLYVQGYLANISEMDARLGEILDAIEASGRSPVIAFWSDHGYMMGDHDHLGKFTLWEQSSSTPLVIADPLADQKGLKNDSVVSLLDMMPTLLELAGVAVPQSVEGQSLADLVHDPGQHRPGHALTAMMGSVSLRTDAFRLNRYEDGSRELFDIRRDPENRFDLSDDPRYAPVLSSLLQTLLDDLAAKGVSFIEPASVVRLSLDDRDVYYFHDDASDMSAVSDAGGHDVGISNNPIVTMPEWLEDLETGRTSSNSWKPSVVTGNRLDNRIHGAAGADTFSGLGGDDSLIGDRRADHLDGGDGDDTLVGGSGDDILFGSDGADTLEGGPGADLIDGGRGLDVASLVASPTGVRLDLAFPSLGTGEARGDLLTSVEHVYVTSHDDFVAGSLGRDVIVAEAGDDVVLGRSGDDALYGGRGNDVLIGGRGADRLNGGSGRDVAQYTHTGEGVVIDLVVPARNRQDAAGDVLVSIELVKGSQHDDVIGGRREDDVLFGLGGNDTLDGRGGADTVLGLDGDDVLDGGPGRDFVAGGPGDDVLEGGPGRDSFALVAGPGTRDVIIDFSPGEDVIAFYRFSGLAVTDVLAGALRTADGAELVLPGGQVVELTGIVPAQLGHDDFLV